MKYSYAKLSAMRHFVRELCEAGLQAITKEAPYLYSILFADNLVTDTELRLIIKELFGEPYLDDVTQNKINKLIDIYTLAFTL